MKTMTAAEAKNSFGELLDATMREPVMITKIDRPVAVTLSMDDLKDIAQSGADESGSDALERLIERARIHKRIAAAQTIYTNNGTARVELRNVASAERCVMTAGERFIGGQR